MAQFSKHEEDVRGRFIVAGNSGTGKTSLLASIANAGFRLCIIDADNGLEILDTYLTDKGRENTHYITLVDDKVKKISAWGRFCKLLNEGWKDKDEDLGSIFEWEKDTVLAVDTMNHLGKAALRAVLSQKGLEADAQPEIQHWGEAARRLEQRISRICSKSTKCHVVFNTHLRSIEDDYGRVTFYPNTGVGKSFNMDVGTYFNTLVRLDVKAALGANKKEKRVLKTIAEPNMALKTAKPNIVQAEEEFDLGKLLIKMYGEPNI